jgi:outer membrane protein insertion porin family
MEWLPNKTQMINMFRKFLLFITLLLGAFTIPAFSQVSSVGGDSTLIDYANPKEYEIGPIRIEGADNYDHQAIKLIAGLRQGQNINIPGEKISKAIQNLWNEGIFSDVEIYADKEVAGIIYLVIAVTPRPKLSRFKFKGVNKREADKIREEISLYSGKTITENLVFTTQNNTFYWANIIVISTPTNNDVLVRRSKIIGWVKIKPTDSWIINLNPSMRSIRTY